MKNKYKIEQKIHTLVKNTVTDENGLANFNIDEMIFSHVDFSDTNDLKKDYWLVKAEIESDNYKKAYQSFSLKLRKIIPKISLIGQCYISSVTEPFLISKNDTDVAFFRHIKDSSSVGLMFMENEKKALDILMKREDIPEEFFYYWNDAVNAFGYSAKLLLMFSAIEALVKKKNGKKNFEKLENILGMELKNKIWGKEGLRNRLVHGEYFESTDSGNNYLDMVHKKVISWFNDNIFENKELIREQVVNPQRHIFGNKKSCNFFIEKINDSINFSLLDVIKCFSNGKSEFESKKYKYCFKEGLESKF